MKQVTKRVIGIVVTFSLFIGICAGMNYAYVSYDPWSRILFHSYYEQENIDNLFLGSSHLFCGVDPAILDEMNGQNNFNLSTPGQRWDNTYYLLKDAVSQYDIKHVYLECYYWDLIEREKWLEDKNQAEVVDFIDDPENYHRPWLIADEMKLSTNSIAMLLQSADLNHTFETWIPYVRYRQNLFNWEQVKKNIADKTSEDYRQYRYREEEEDDNGNVWISEYHDKGFLDSEGKVLIDSEKIYKITGDFRKFGIGEKSEKYFRKTIEYCQSHDIEVTLFITPIYDNELMSTCGYDGFLEELNGIAKEYDIDLYDFNLVKEEVLDIKHGEYFLDIGHLNGDGAKLFTPVMWKVLSDTPKNNKAKFYSSYSERLKNEEPAIYGVYYDKLGADEANTSYPISRYTIAGNKEDMEYCVVQADTGEIIQEYSTNNTFDLPIDATGVMTIFGKYEDDIIEISVIF